MAYGGVFGLCSAFGDNFFVVCRTEKTGLVGMFSVHVDDVLVCTASFARLGIMSPSALRLGRLEIAELESRGATSKLTRCGFEMERSPDGSLRVSQRSSIGRLPPMVAPGRCWTQRDKAMESSIPEAPRLLLGELSGVAAGSRPDISARLGELGERVDNLKNMDSFAIDRLAPNVRGAVDLQALKFPSSIDATRLQLGVEKGFIFACNVALFFRLGPFFWVRFIKEISVTGGPGGRGAAVLKIPTYSLSQKAKKRRTRTFGPG